MDTFNTRRIRLRHLIDELTGGNVAVFAARFGYSAAQISQYLSPSYNDGRSMGERAARALEKKISIPQGWLDQVVNPVAPSNAREAYAAADSMLETHGQLIPRHIPVRYVGTTAGETGMITLHESVEATPEYVEFVSRSADAYAIQMKGQDLKPRIRSGEFLIIEPTLKPQPGDDVIVRFVSDETVILQFLYMRGSEATFGPVNEIGTNASCDDSEIIDISVITAVLRNTSLENLEKSPLDR